MIKLDILFFLCIIISTGYSQELSGYNNFPGFENSGLQVHYGEPQELRTKPCSHRRSNVQAEEQWIPSFRSMVRKPLNKDVLKALALKNGNIDNTDDKSTAMDNRPIDPSPNRDNSIAISPNVASNILNEPYQDKTYLDRPDNSEDQSNNEDYDCTIDLDSRNNFEFESGQSVGLPLKPTVEDKVMEMLRDCFNKKQKNTEGFYQPEVIPLAGSRRSMGNSDNDDEDVINLKLAGENDVKQATNNKKTIDAVNNISEDEASVLETASFTHRPSKQLNDLDNPEKVTGISDSPVSRRMQAENSKVCYACSTATNPSCWAPDNRTTIKYCRQDQNCVTKSFGVKNSLTILRDCAKSCEASSVPGIEPKYKSCSVCHKDLCNSAAINSNNLFIIFLITAIKCSF